MTRMTLAEALALARELGVERLDAQLLLAHLLERDRGWLISHDDAVLTQEQARRITELLQQRAAGMPFAYLVGEQEFHGLRLQVTRDTLVPRADTETLVDWALELLAAMPGTLGPSGAPRVVDLGTGSGAIALALKHRYPAAQVEAVDLSAGALDVARANAQRLGLEVRFHQGSWWAPLAGQRFELIVSNPPYIAGEDPHLPALRFEPLSALTPGGDGLADLHTLIEGAPEHLQPGGWLMLEHGYDQAEPVAAALRARGFAEPELRRDLGGQPRVSAARWPR